MRLPLPKRLKTTIKNRLKSAQLAWQRWRYRFTEADFADALMRVGLEPGDSIIVHSSFDKLVGFTGRASNAIAVLKEAVGENGNIMMPTMPFMGTAISYVADKPKFDVNRTPSRMGLISEIFRRDREVLRSVHPTHPVAVWGSDARSITEGHENSRTPCGYDSPFMKLYEREGKILFLGVSIESMTFFHFIEAILEDDLPFPVFTEETYILKSSDTSGRAVVTETRLFNSEWSRRRQISRLIPGLQRAGHWSQTKVGLLEIICLPTHAILDEATRLANQREYCYE